jgi:hypothetical protein
MLQKSPAILLLPYTAMLLIADAWRRGINRQVLLQVGRDIVLWSLVVTVVYMALWPAMWSNPVGTIRQVLGKASGYAEAGHEAGNFFLGQPVHDPGWGYYPVAVALRLSPLVFIGVIASLVWLVRGREVVTYRFGVAALLLYGLLYSVFMSFGAKKLDRYLMPIFPALGIVAAVGLLGLLDATRRRLGRTLAHPLSLYSLTCLIVLVFQLLLVLPHYPHYLTYYNPLLGGLLQARKTLVVGWGEGYEQAAAYLNDKSDAQELQAVVPTFTAFAPLFLGETRPISDYSAARTDYVVFYLAQVQRQHDEVLMKRYFSNPQVQAEHTVILHGVEYAWVYPNLHYIEPMRYVEAHSQPSQDVLMVNGDSVFGRHYQGALEVREFYSQSSPTELAQLLDDLPSSSQRVWYPRYSGTDPDGAMQLLNNRALLVEQQDYADVKVFLYRLLEEAAMHSLDLRFGDLRLRGHGTTDPSPAWGRDGGVILAWECGRALEKDYTAFVHLYDSHGHRIAQGDSLIVDHDLRPTSQWEGGSSGTTLHHLSIPVGTPPGRYEVQVGVYVLETGDRLTLLSPEGSPQGTSAQLKMEVGIPEQMPQVADLDIQHTLEQRITPRIELLGYDLEHEEVLVGEQIPLHLYWKALDSLTQDYRIQVILRARDGQVYGRETFSLVSTYYPATRWRPGELLHDWYYVPVGEEVPTGNVSVTLNLLDEHGEPVLARPQAIAELWVQSTRPSFDAPTGMAQACQASLGDSVDLLGYDVETVVKLGENVEVTLYWRARQEMETSYKVFVHLYDARGEILAQQDRVPGLGARPTTAWQQGEVLADRYSLPVGLDSVPGPYQLAVGLYDPQTGGRLAAYGADGARLSEDRILLRKVQVQP